MRSGRIRLPTGRSSGATSIPRTRPAKNGPLESPLDIKGAVPAELAPIHFDYKLSPLKIINNGYTVQINYEAGSSITVNGAAYDLIQFHFHHPSETEIDGIRGDLEFAPGAPQRAGAARRGGDRVEGRRGKMLRCASCGVICRKTSAKKRSTRKCS